MTVNLPGDKSVDRDSLTTRKFKAKNLDEDTSFTRAF